MKKRLKKYLLKNLQKTDLKISFLIFYFIMILYNSENVRII